ncbi:MAG: transporter substrate-binding domain-containing protein [Synechococcaceae cyanobacterium]|nr:transporter substrate-binding domain-containing protein [Synechococcaceae cyanobacterium]
MARRRRLLLTLLLLVPWGSAGLAQQAAPAAAVLRVGVVDGSQPCAWREGEVWKGLAVDLWNRIASREQLAFVMQPLPSTAALLEAAAADRVDVAIGCLNVSPERLQRLRFSLPFQEDGLAVMVPNSRLDLGRAFLSSLFGPTLLQLLGGYLVAIALLTALAWRVEGYGSREQTRHQGRMRSVSKLFQVLATGPGGNVVVDSTRGNLIVLAAYLVRIVSASLLVGYLTVTVVNETQGRLSGRFEAPDDLRGLRVAVRPGSVSEALLREVNSRGSGRPARAVLIRKVAEGPPLLRRGLVDAVLADNLQLTWLQAHQGKPGQRRVPLQTRLALQGIRPESQAFVFAPSLPEATAERINLAISAVKRSGVVSELRESLLAAPGGR